MEPYTSIRDRILLLRAIYFPEKDPKQNDDLMFLSMKADFNNFGVRMALLNMMLMVKVWYKCSRFWTSISYLQDIHMLRSPTLRSCFWRCSTMRGPALNLKSRVKKIVGGIEMGFAKFTTLIASRLSCFFNYKPDFLLFYIVINSLDPF